MANLKKNVGTFCLQIQLESTIKNVPTLCQISKNVIYLIKKLLDFFISCFIFYFLISSQFHGKFQKNRWSFFCANLGKSIVRFLPKFQENH